MKILQIGFYTFVRLSSRSENGTGVKHVGARGSMNARKRINELITRTFFFFRIVDETPYFLIETARATVYTPAASTFDRPIAGGHPVDIVRGALAYALRGLRNARYASQYSSCQKYQTVQSNLECN